MSAKLTKAELDFVEAVAKGWRIGIADRAADRVRQKCRRAGLVEVLKNPRRWHVTEAGLGVLLSPPVSADDGER